MSVSEAQVAYKVKAAKTIRDWVYFAATLPMGTLRFGPLKFIYATSGKGRDIAEKKNNFTQNK